jgi:hypothetical protein
MGLRKAILKEFSSGGYTATLQLTGSYKAYLEGVPVARNLPVSEMTVGRKVAIFSFDENNAREMVVIAVYA